MPNSMLCSGYMAPEYACYGLFSVKSDVFSFGILLLELVSGKKNREFIHSKYHYHLIGYVSKLMKISKKNAIASCIMFIVLSCMV